ncbi:hypothetical protein BV20DRAFT_794277 [Pilatotrama ljubarskyi]|nr:hypothetical protein BV20DRAFT_794277 [Pilatotrama ljubarskyi]
MSPRLRYAFCSLLPPATLLDGNVFQDAQPVTSCTVESEGLQVAAVWLIDGNASAHTRSAVPVLAWLITHPTSILTVPG